MPHNVTQKLIKAHLVEGEMIPGTEIGLKIAQTLTQDATGTFSHARTRSVGTCSRSKQNYPCNMSTTISFAKITKTLMIIYICKVLPKIWTLV